jgi:hypothetical protein
MARIFIYPKDIATLTGLSIKQAQRIYKQVKDSLGKKEFQNLAISEYANYENIDPQLIESKLK